MMQLEIATHQLRFTGNCDEAEFKARCAQHDFWYHSYYFDNGFAQRGDYDIGRDIDSYGFPQDMTGLSVLDIGTGSGWFATYFEQHGADVTTVDARGYCDFDVFGRVPAYPAITAEKAKADRILPDGREIYYSPVSKGYWIMKDMLGLQGEYVNARIYDICPRLFGGKTFDLVFMGAVLMHLRDPIGALMAARSVCKHRLMASSYMLNTPTIAPAYPPPQPAKRSLGQRIQGRLRRLLAGGNDGTAATSWPGIAANAQSIMMMQEGAGDGISWWCPNRSCLLQWFKGAGFPSVEISNAVQLSADKPFVDEVGRSSGVNQTVTMVNAYV